MEYAEELSPLKNKLIAMTELYEKAVVCVTDTKNTEYVDFHARRLVEMAGHIIMGYLLMGDASRNANFLKSTNVYINYGEAEVDKNYKLITTSDPDKMSLYK